MDDIHSDSQKNGGQSPLTEFVMGSASRLVSGMLEAEVEEFLSKHAQLADQDGKPRVVRNGYLPERKVKTALGRVSVRIPRVRDRLKATGSERIRFNSRIISPYQRRTTSRTYFVNRFLTELSKGDFEQAAIALLGIKDHIVTPAIIRRLKETFVADSTAHGQAEMGQFVRVWVDRLRAESDVNASGPSIIVAIGETDRGQKRLLLVMDEQKIGLDLYRTVADKLDERGVLGQPVITLSPECWGAKG